MSKRIELTQGKFAVVDDADFEFLNQWKWHARRNGRNCYAGRGIRINGMPRIIGMHQVILNLPSGMKSDHINGDGLDNRRSNLRSCTHCENMRNRSKNIRDSSRYKGVFWDKATQKWRARISINSRETHLGYFDDEEKAACAYNAAARKHFGEFARLNVIEKPNIEGIRCGCNLSAPYPVRRRGRGRSLSEGGGR